MPRKDSVRQRTPKSAPAQPARAKSAPAKRKPAKDSYHHGDLRPALVEAALEIIDQEGLSGLSLRAVARRVGVSHAAPAHHFADKAALLATVAARGFAELAAALEDGERRGSVEGPIAALREAGRGYVRFALGRPRLYRLMFDPNQELHRIGDAELASESLRALGALERVASQAAPELPPGYAALSAWSSVHGAVLLHQDGLAQVVLRLAPSTSARDASAAFQTFAEQLTQQVSVQLGVRPAASEASGAGD